MNNKNSNYLKKIFYKIKENFMSDDIKNEIKIELLEPMFIEMKNFILPHYIIFIVLLLIIIILILYLIIIIYNINNYHIIK
jgi:hypothetical protein